MPGTGTMMGAGLVVAGLAALGFLPMTATPTGLLRSVIKTLPLVIFAVLCWMAGGPLWLTLGLALSALGDWALSRDGERAFLVGLIGFALAHVCYVILFVGLGGGWSIWIALGFVLFALSSEVWLAPYTEDLRWPVRLYVVLICVMAILAFGVPSDYRLASWGAAFFLASDLVLSLQLFRMQTGTEIARWAGYLLWILYIAGQSLILFAFLPVPGLF
nr:lysoplasmalogenase [uncultured Celeribacter sp.]